MKHLLSALFALALLLTAGRASASSTEAPMVGDLALTRFYYSIQGSMMPRSWEIRSRPVRSPATLTLSPKNSLRIP